MKRKLTALLLLLALLLSLTACGDAAQTIDTVQQAAQTVQEIAAAQEEETPAIEEDGTYTTKEDVVRYIHTYGHLPETAGPTPSATLTRWERRSAGVSALFSPTTDSSITRRTTMRRLSFSTGRTADGNHS